jgi:hypothetical protein
MWFTKTKKELEKEKKEKENMAQTIIIFLVVFTPVVIWEMITK